MPDDKITAEELFNNLLPIVVKAATRAAEASTLAATALASFEAKLTEHDESRHADHEKLRLGLKAVEDAIRELDTTVANCPGNSKEKPLISPSKPEPPPADADGKSDLRKAIASVLRPDIIYITLLIIAGFLGLRLSLPEPIETPRPEITVPPPTGGTGDHDEGR